MRRCHFKIFLFLALAAILVSGEEPFSNFCKRAQEEHFCETILKLGH